MLKMLKCCNGPSTKRRKTEITEIWPGNLRHVRRCMWCSSGDAITSCDVVGHLGSFVGDPID